MFVSDMASRLFALSSIFNCFILFYVDILGWAWLGGAQIVDQTSTRQYPGGRSGASTWHDCNLNLTWVFGGKGFSDLPSGLFKFQLIKFIIFFWWFFFFVL